MNSNREIHISLSTLALIFCLLLTALGWAASPRNEQGRPLLLLADVKAVEEYRRLAIKVMDELRLVDGEIAATLAGDTADLFGQTRAAQKAFEHILAVGQEIDRFPSPPALSGLREELNRTSLAYLEAARQTLRWLSAPDAANSELARQKLSEAKQRLGEVENNQWLQMRSP